MKNLMQIFVNPRMLLVILLGFSSGLPLAMIGSTLQAWLADSKVDLASIGIIALVGLPHAVKFLWAPLLDSVKPPFWGRRRGWAFLILLGLILSELCMSFLHPEESLTLVQLVALLVAFFSASQDIVVDAFRTEILEKEEYGIGAGAYTMGYRIAMLVSGAVALSLADHLPWRTVYVILAAVQCLGLVAIFLAKESPYTPPARLPFKERISQPFIELFQRAHAWEILAFVMVYKLGTMMGTSLTTAFLLAHEFTKTEIAFAAKTVGLIATIVGALVGGAMMMRLGMKRSLWTFGILQAAGIPLFILVVILGHNYAAMLTVIAAENFMIGLGVAAIQAFIMSVCNVKFTGTQYALFSSLTAVTRVIFSSQAGRVVEHIGWINFFIFSAALSIPGLLLLTQFSKWSTGDVEHSQHLGISKMESAFMALFMFGLFLICAELIWKPLGLGFIAAQASFAGAIISTVGLVGGIVSSRTKMRVPSRGS